MGDDGSGVDELLNVPEGGGSLGFLGSNVGAELVVLETLAFGSGGSEGEPFDLNLSLLGGDLLVLLLDSGFSDFQFAVLLGDVLSEELDGIKWGLDVEEGLGGGGLLFLPSCLSGVHGQLGAGNGTLFIRELLLQSFDLLLKAIGACDLVILGLFLGIELWDGAFVSVLHVFQNGFNSGDLVREGGVRGDCGVISGLGGGLSVDFLVVGEVSNFAVGGILFIFFGSFSGLNTVKSSRLVGSCCSFSLALFLSIEGNVSNSLSL